MPHFLHFADLLLSTTRFCYMLLQRILDIFWTNYVHSACNQLRYAYIRGMRKRTTRIQVYRASHERVRLFAKRMNLTVPEAYSRLAEFGMDALLRQKTLLLGCTEQEVLVTSPEGIDDVAF